MDEVLAFTLRDAVYGRLDYLDRLVADADLPSRAALADTEIARMTTAWRALLCQHQPGENGRCPQCSGWRRPRRRPCSVWSTAYQHLIAANGLPCSGTGRHATASRTPERRGAGGLLTRLLTGGERVVPRPGAFPATHRPGTPAVSLERRS